MGSDKIGSKITEQFEIKTTEGVGIPSVFIGAKNGFKK